MKLHFEADLSYQANAIEAVCDLFRGQEVCRSEFTVTLRAAGTTGEADASPLQGTREGMAETPQGGVGNRLTLLDDEVNDNLKAIQLRNGCRRRPSCQATSPSRWRPAPARPTCTCARCSS